MADGDYALMKYDTYTCDRCGKEFRKETGHKPDHILTSYNGENQAEYDLCADCAATFAYFMERKTVKRFDDVADKIVQETTA